MTPSSIITPLANALVERAETAGATGAVRWAPSDISPPAAVIELPSFERTGVDESEDHFGQRDWTLNFPVIFYFDLATAQADQDRAVDVVEAFVLAIDADNGLANLCQEAKVVDGSEPEFPADDARALIRWPTVVSVLKFV